MAEVYFEVLAEGLAFPEGPVVMPDGSVVVCELLGGRLTRVWGDGRKEVLCQTGGGPNGANLGADGALYVCNSGGADPANPTVADPNQPGRIERVDPATGRFERIVDNIGGRVLGSPNDIVVDADGNLWFTDLGKVLLPGYGRGGVYWCRPDGSDIREVLYGEIGYNGIGLSPDQKTLYVAMTHSGRLYRAAITGPGEIAREPGLRGFAMHLVGAAAGDAEFDSLAVTAAGNICVGTLYLGGITVISPAGEARHVALPDSHVTNIAFGGEDMRDAYITFAGSGRLVRMRWDEPGLRLNFA